MAQTQFFQARESCQSPKSLRVKFVVETIKLNRLHRFTFVDLQLLCRIQGGPKIPNKIQGIAYVVVIESCGFSSRSHV